MAHWKAVVVGVAVGLAAGCSPGGQSQVARAGAVNVRELAFDLVPPVVPSFTDAPDVSPTDPRTCVSTAVISLGALTEPTDLPVALDAAGAGPETVTVTFYVDPGCTTTLEPSASSGKPMVTLPAGMPTAPPVYFKASGPRGASARITPFVPADTTIVSNPAYFRLGLPDAFAFTQQPPASVALGAPFTVALGAVDWFGAPVTTGTVDVIAGDLVTLVSTTLVSLPVVSGAASGVVSVPFSTPRCVLFAMLMRPLEGLTAFAVGAEFVVRPGPLASLSLTPEVVGTVVAGAPIPLSARLLDGATPPNPVYATTVSVSLASGSATLLGATVRRTDDLGVADFTDLAITTAGSYALRVRSDPLEVGTPVFEVVPGPAGLSFQSGPPATVVAGAAFGVTVRLADRWGNPVAGTPRLALVGPGGAVLEGADVSTGSSGVTTFGALQIARAGTYALEATYDAGGLSTSAVSASFDVVPGAPAALRFVDFQTTTGTSGFALTPAIQVEVVDAQGNVAVTSTAPVTLSTTPAVTLTGTVQRAPLAGLVSFTDVVVTAAGTYRLVATQGGLQVEAPATTIVYAPGSTLAADHLSWATPPRSAATGACSDPMRVEVRDVNGDRVSLGAPVTLAIASVPGVTYFADATCDAAPVTTVAIGLAGVAELRARASAAGSYTIAVQANLSGINGSAAGTRTAAQSFVVAGAAPASPPKETRPLNGWSAGCGAAGGAPSAATLVALVAVALWRRRRSGLAVLLAVVVAGPASAAPRQTAQPRGKAPAPAAAPAAAPEAAPAPAPVAIPVPLPPPPQPAARPARPRDARPALAVLNVESTGAGQALDLAALTDVFASAIDEPRWFRVISARDVMAALALERQRELLGCSADQGCLAELAGALGVDYVAAASVGNVGRGHVVSGRILDARRGVALARVSANADADGLVEAIAEAGRGLLEAYREARPREERERLVIPEGRGAGSRGPGRLALRAAGVAGYAPGADEGARATLGVEAGITWRLSSDWSLAVLGVGGPNPGVRAGAFRALWHGPVRLSLGLRAVGWPGAAAYGGGPALEAALALGRTVEAVATVAGEGYAAEARYGRLAVLGGLGLSLRL